MADAPIMREEALKERRRRKHAEKELAELKKVAQQPPIMGGYPPYGMGMGMMPQQSWYPPPPPQFQIPQGLYRPQNQLIFSSSPPYSGFEDEEDLPAQGLRTPLRKVVVDRTRSSPVNNTMSIPVQLGILEKVCRANLPENKLEALEKIFAALKSEFLDVDEVAVVSKATARELGIPVSILTLIQAQISHTKVEIRRIITIEEDKRVRRQLLEEEKRVRSRQLEEAQQEALQRDEDAANVLALLRKGEAPIAVSDDAGEDEDDEEEEDEYDEEEGTPRG